MKVIREFTDPIHAGLVQSVLRSNEIEAVLFDEGASAWTSVRLMVPIRLAVPEEQADEARKVLRAFEDAEPGNDVAG